MVTGRRHSHWKIPPQFYAPRTGPAQRRPRRHRCTTTEDTPVDASATSKESESSSFRAAGISLLGNGAAYKWTFCLAAGGCILR
jgi:hypothetical protein